MMWEVCDRGVFMRLVISNAGSTNSMARMPLKTRFMVRSVRAAGRRHCSEAAITWRKVRQPYRLPWQGACATALPKQVSVPTLVSAAPSDTPATVTHTTCS